MNPERLAAIRAKNAAYHKLMRGVAECHKRKVRGPVPFSWLARLRQLEAEYERTLAALSGDRAKV